MHLLNLLQVTDTKDLPPIWEALARASKQQKLLVLQWAFDTATEDMGLRAPTIATPSLLKLALALSSRMEIRYDLTTGLHPFFLGQHTAMVRKFLRGQATDTPWWPPARVHTPCQTWKLSRHLTA